MIKKQTLLILLMLPFLAFAQTEVRVTDADIPVGANVTWTPGNIYILDGMVFVDSAATLTIEAGTIIKAEDGQDTEASGLVVTRHAKIFAEGTANRPIIFTSVNDDLNGNLAFDDRGEWGGVVLLGLAPTNNDSQKSIEGVNEIDAERSRFGGDDPHHSSGVFRYVSIRHTGINIGSSTGNEIQGLTAGGLGDGTVLEYVESYASDDDGFEFFGGTVNTRYLAAAFCSDDAFDWDQGFNGKHQFWFAIQAGDKAGRVAEMDGAGGNDQGTPFATPMLSNVTYIGAGSDSQPDGDGGQLLLFRDNTGGFYYNSIFTAFNGFEGGLGITIEDVDNSGEKVEDSRKRLEAGDLKLENNLWFDFAAGNAITEFSDQDFVQAYLGDAANGNRVEAPQLRGISRTTDKGLDPRPASGSPAWTGSKVVDDDYFVQTSYVGAFGGNNWLLSWTALDQLGYLADPVADPGTRTITDADIPVGSNVTFYSDTTYILDGMVFVDSAATLTIEAGTLIKAEDGQDTEASGLVVTRHAKIFAEGTANRPIIFTSVNDDLNGNLAFDDRGEWGGVVLLGLAPTNNDSQKSIEGVNEIDAERSRFGGDDPHHSSGVFRYVSIRHTGINIGSSTGNEIQGLTAGGLGDGTVLEYVESYASDDDGFEFFGGTVNTRYLAAAFCSDDAFDWDQGFNGKHQFWFAIQAGDKAGRVAEMDGAGGNDQGTPFATPMLSNVTYIGAGSDSQPDGDGGQLLLFRDNTGGFYYNSIFTAFNGFEGGLGITIEDVDNSGEKVEDSRKRLEAGDLKLENNLWFDFAAGNAITEFSDQDFVQAYLGDAANGNRVEAPQLRGISRTTDKGLDPRPASGSPAWTGSKVVDDDYFVQTSYVGAFGGNNWLLSWTALDQLGYVTDVVTSVDETELVAGLPATYELAQNYPNPFNPSTTIRVALPEASNVKLTVYNILGQEVAQLINGFRNAGTYNVVWNAQEVSTGIYVYRLEAGSNVITKKMTLIK